MSYDMYKPEKSSKVYMYIFFFTTVVLSWSLYVYTRPLVVENACSEISQKTTGLTSFKYDPLADYDYSKAKCMEDVLSAEK